MKNSAVSIISILVLLIALVPPLVSTAQDISALTWQARINRTVHKAHHWTFTLRGVERRQDQLLITLAFKNNGNNKRPILLDANFMQSVVLHDEDNQHSYKLISVEGISAEMSQVDRKSTRKAVFVFAYPKNSAKVRFTSRWLTMFMANGAASIINVDFKLPIPPPEAQSG